MVSAYRHDEIIARADQLGVGSFLFKPIEKSLLLETIASIFIKTGHSSTIGQAMPVAKPPPLALRGARVLLAEDNDINRLIATELLTEAGVQVDIAVTGQEAVAKVLGPDSAWYDAVLMDVQMPEMDGLEATGQIRCHISRSRLPIIAMTAHAMEEERQRCLAAGMDDHIAKPIDPAVLYQTLSRWIKPREVEADAEPKPFRQAPQSTPQPLITKTPFEQLPDTLPPFNLVAAEARMGGARDLLRQVIVSFHSSYAGVNAEFDKLLNENRLDELLLLAHTLKGLAATLGATTLSDAAAALENALRSGRISEVPSLIGTLKAELAPALAAAARIAPMTGAEPGGGLPSAAGSVFDRDEVNRLVVELETLLAKNSVRANKVLMALRELLAGYNLDSYLNALTVALDRFDFRGAERALAVLAVELPPEGPQS